jgi:hypothetical protein
MQIITGEDIQTMTGYKNLSGQKQWFIDRGYSYQVSNNKQLWTTDDWMNGKDKYKAVNDNDGFNLGALKNVS